MCLFPRLSRQTTRKVSLWFATLAAIHPIAFIHATERNTNSDRTQAVELVSQAILAGSQGDNKQRRALLERALEVDPQCVAARQALGQVQRQNQWLDPNSEINRVAADPKEQQYLELRDSAPDSVAGQRELALWCAARGLHDRSRCHWQRVLDWEPNHLEARRQLDFQLVAGRWISQQEINEAQARLEQDQVNFAETDRMMLRLSERLKSSSPHVRAQALEELKGLQDPRTLVALELLAASSETGIALVVLETISQFEQPRATEALARLAVTNPSDQIRNAAALALHSRDPIEFVPPLLGELRMPVSVTAQVVPIQSRTLLFREVFTSEDRETQSVAVRDTGLRRETRPFGNSANTLGRMLTDIAQETRDTRSDVQDVNRQILLVNQRVITALRRATGEDLERDPRTWWEWWNEANGIESTTKPVTAAYASREYQYTDTPEFTVQGSIPRPTPPPTFQTECLAAGTLVTTDRGPLPIEAVVIGDRVLAQHPIDGRIEFRAVRRCTVRRPSPLVAITLGDETIRSSAGHPFWVVNRGWTLARHLEPGMMLHTQEGAVRIEAIESAASETTFNLVVDDFATYFVGKSRVLGHDFTERSPSQVLVPGLAP